MKINGKKILSSTKQTSSPTDELSRKAISIVDGIQIKSFNPNETWLKISSRLSNMDKKFVVWGITMAASFSLLIAASIQVFVPELLDTDIYDHQISTASINETQNQPGKTVNHSKGMVSTIKIKAKKPTAVASLQEQTSTINIAKKAENSFKRDLSNIKSAEELDLKPLISNPFVSAFAKVQFQETGFIPEVGIDFKVKEMYTAKRRQVFKIGMSSQFNMTENENGDRKVLPQVFVNLEVISLNKKTNKGWTARAGYLLNPDETLYQDTTFKVSIMRNMGRHLKIGPEVIISDTFKKVYPGISLILG